MTTPASCTDALRELERSVGEGFSPYRSLMALSVRLALPATAPRGRVDVRIATYGAHRVRAFVSTAGGAATATIVS